MLHSGPLPTFPHPGGPHRTRDGISWESRSDRKSVCWPITLFWPKYSSSEFGLSASAKGLFKVSKLLRDILCDAFDVSSFGTETWVSVPAVPGSTSLGKLRFNPLLAATAAACLLDMNPLLSLETGVWLLLVWNKENTGALEDEPASVLLTAEKVESGSVVTRGFFRGGSSGGYFTLWLLSATLSWRHASRCPLIVAALKSLKQTGHCTMPVAVDGLSFAMLVPAKRLTFDHVINLTWRANVGNVFNKVERHYFWTIFLRYTRSIFIYP